MADSAVTEVAKVISELPPPSDSAASLITSNTVRAVMMVPKPGRMAVLKIGKIEASVPLFRHRRWASGHDQFSAVGRRMVSRGLAGKILMSQDRHLERQ